MNKLSLRNFLELNGNLVYLKKLDKEFAEEYWNSLSNGSIETMIFTGTAQVFNKTGLEGFIDAVASDRNRVDFLIFAKENDRIVGEVVINDIARNNRSANIRIAISNKADYGKGYGTEAMILALQYGFGMQNLHRIELDVMAFNERASHVYEKLGFKREGIRRDAYFFNHRYHDAVTMSILEEEFREKYLDGLEELESMM